MKKTLTILSVALVAFMLSSCVEKSKKYQQLLAEKDAIVLENNNIEKEYNAALGIISDVENNLSAIRDAEGLMLIKNENNTQRDQLNSELIQIKEAMAINRARLDSLSEALNNSNKDRSYLRNTIKKLQNQIAEKEQVIVEGYNMVSKNQRAKGRTQQSGIIKKEAPIHVSNVMVVCPKCGMQNPVGSKFCNECGEKL